MSEEQEKPDNAASKDGVKKKERKVSTQEDQLNNDLRVLMNMPEGRRFLWRLLDSCHVFNLSYQDRGGNNRTFFNEGSRHIGLQCLAWMSEAHEEMAAKVFIEKISQLKNYGEN